MHPESLPNFTQMTSCLFPRELWARSPMSTFFLSFWFSKPIPDSPTVLAFQNPRASLVCRARSSTHLPHTHSQGLCTSCSGLPWQQPLSSVLICLWSIWLTLLVSVTEHMTERETREEMFTLAGALVYSIMAGLVWQREQEMAGQITSTVRKQQE